MTTSIVQQRAEKALAQFAKYGGKGQPSEDDLVFEGTRFVIPAGMSEEQAYDFLGKHIKSQRETANFIRTFKYRPNDGAYALQQVLYAAFGTRGTGKTVWSFLGAQHPPMVTIDIGFEETASVSMGYIEVPQIAGTIQIGYEHDREKGPLFQLMVQCPKRLGPSIQGLFDMVEDYLKESSIYRGKAINAAEVPEFINVNATDRTRVVYPTKVEEQLSANIWAPIRHLDLLKKMKIPFKRAILLSGDFGVGKTLSAHVSAQICAENGVTFIHVRPEDDLQQALHTAMLYQPALLFGEDLDTVASSNNQDAASSLLDAFDGIGAKGRDVMVVMTTNYPERIIKGMLRPGRLDAVIAFTPYDTDAVEKLIGVLAPEGSLSANINWEPVHKALVNYNPAFIAEVVKRAVLYNVDRTNGDPGALTTEDLVAAGEGLRPQFEDMTGAGEGTGLPTMDMALQGAVSAAVTKVMDQARLLDYDGDFTGSIQVSTE